jgi:hypothetical protein
VYVEISGDQSETGPAARQRIDQEAEQLAEAVVLALLARVDLPMEPWMMGASDLVSIGHKRSLFTLLPSLASRLANAETPHEREDAERWLDRELAPFGTDARRLVAGAVHRWLDQTEPAGADHVRSLFPSA